MGCALSTSKYKSYNYVIMDGFDYYVDRVEIGVIIKTKTRLEERILELPKDGQYKKLLRILKYYYMQSLEEKHFNYMKETRASYITRLWNKSNKIKMFILKETSFLNSIRYTAYNLYAIDRIFVTETLKKQYAQKIIW